MTAVREVGAELAIARRSLIRNRDADSTGSTLAMAGPSAYEQMKELIRSEAEAEEGQQTTPTVLIADAQ
eukprot:2879980-Pyramimonas_sp.AAC.1